jgi:uncharacterized protein YndB with AHSA1/START domain
VARTTEAVAIERELLIDASPETVWELLVDPEKSLRWMGMESWSEPRPGGVYRVEIIPGHIASGEFVELDPPHRLVFTWGWEGDDNPVAPGSSTIEFTLTADGDGTRVQFTHSGLPTAESSGSHGHGWDHYFERLVTAGAGGDPGRDPWIDSPMS